MSIQSHKVEKLQEKDALSLVVEYVGGHGWQIRYEFAV